MAASETLLRARYVFARDAGLCVIADGGVVVSGDRIADVGEFESVRERWPHATLDDLGNAMLLPGLVDAHCHASMTLFRGLADDLPLIEWLETHIWPVEAKLSGELIELGASLACAELTRTGTTAFMDGYFHEHRVAQAVDAAGLRVVLGEGFFNFPSPMFPEAKDCWAVQRKLAADCAQNPRVRMSIAPHAAYTVRPEFLRESFELAEELEVPWQIHLAESKAETESCLKLYGKRPVQVLHENGLLSPRTVLHHGVDLEDEEISLIAESETCVVHNPASNLKLASGLARVQDLLDAGVVVGLGTDGAGSNNQLNMFRDMGLAALIGKVCSNDATAVSAHSVLEMATVGSARCIGWEELGRIEIGRPADLVALGFDTPNYQPVHAPVSHVVYASTGKEVFFSMVAGEVVYRDGEYKKLDVSSLFREAEKAVKWMSSRI